MSCNAYKKFSIKKETRNHQELSLDTCSLLLLLLLELEHGDFEVLALWSTHRALINWFTFPASRLAGDSKGTGEHTAAASLGPNLRLQLWLYCCCSGRSAIPPSLPFSILSSPPSLLRSCGGTGRCCSATAVLRFPQWSLEGNKTLPQDKQQREPEGP